MTSNVVMHSSWRPKFYVSTLAPGFDDAAYDDIIATIRRQGFLDALGDDLVPARYDNGNYTICLVDEPNTSAHAFHPPTRRDRFARQATREQAIWEAQERMKQERRERIADEQWKAEEARRAAAAAEQRRAAEQRLALRRAEEARRGPTIPTTDDPAQALRVWAMLEASPVKSRVQRGVDANLRAFWKRHGR